MRKITLLIIAALILLTCGRDKSEKTVIPKDDLVPLLVDLHIVDAISLNATVKDFFGTLDSTLLYGEVMDKHGYRKEQLFSTFEYYTHKPNELMKIYDEVFATLSRLSEEAKAEYNRYSDANTIRVWKPDKNRITVKGRKGSYPGIYDIEIDTTGIYVLNMNIRLTEEDESKNPRVVAYFYEAGNDEPDQRLYFEEIKLYKSRYSRDIIKLQEVRDPKYNKLKIVIPQYDNTDSLFMKGLDMYNVRVSRMKPQEEEERE